MNNFPPNAEKKMRAETGVFGRMGVGEGEFPRVVRFEVKYSRSDKVDSPIC